MKSLHSPWLNLLKEFEKVRLCNCVKPVEERAILLELAIGLAGIKR